MQFLPGQWLDTYVSGIVKAGGFTITSPPSAAAAAVASPSLQDSPYVELAVQHSPENDVAAWLWRPVDEIVGLELRIRVGGSFVFPPVSHPRLAGIRRLVFVAGGVGVNPMMSMLSDMSEHPEWREVEVDFHYATKFPPSDNVADILFLERIASLLDGGGLRGNLTVYLTGDSAARVRQSGSERLTSGAKIIWRKRRPQLGALRDVVTEYGGGSTLVYICGPPTMTDEVNEALAEDGTGRGIPRSHIFTERWW